MCGLLCVVVGRLMEGPPRVDKFMLDTEIQTDRGGREGWHFGAPTKHPDIRPMSLIYQNMFPPFVLRKNRRDWTKVRVHDTNDRLSGVRGTSFDSRSQC